MTAAPVEVRPERLVRICRVLAAVIVVAFGVLALLLPRGSSGDQRFGVGDQVSFFVIGLLLAVGVLALTRARVRANASGVWVRNVLGERFFPWGVVVGVGLPEGAPWAQLELHDDETVALLGIQTSDGDRAVEAVLALRALAREQAGPGLEDPPGAAED
ncbi:MAG: PH domain-containing protein [Mycobacteriales bacterium]